MTDRESVASFIVDLAKALDQFVAAPRAERRARSRRLHCGAHSVTIFATAGDYALRMEVTHLMVIQQKEGAILRDIRRQLEDLAGQERPVCACGSVMSKTGLKVGRTRTEYFRCAACGRSEARRS